jgi:glycosyltransferase involved in cell wall biosynthesis
MKITVVIPTHKRADLLRLALHSVSNQSRTDLIYEVLVSENSADIASLGVVSEFPNLPIRHIFQNPPVDPGTHFASLLDQVSTEWVAMLGDDDEWCRYHLEEAARVLAACTYVVAYFGRDVVIDERGSVVCAPGHSLLLGSDARKRLDQTGYVVLSNAEIQFATLVITPLNMWALVGRINALKSAFTSFLPPAGHDSDRFMIWSLSKCGEIAVGIETTLRYRVHSSNACARYLREDPVFHEQKSHEYTSTMLTECAREGFDIRRLWVESLRELPLHQRRHYWASAITGAKNLIAEAWSSDVQKLFGEADRAFTLKVAFRQLCPPLIWRLAKALKTRVVG